jgi:hypothetical protein
MGTAGLALTLVRGNKRVPCPPPMITARISFVEGMRELLFGYDKLNYNPLRTVYRDGEISDWRNNEPTLIEYNFK